MFFNDRPPFTHQFRYDCVFLRYFSTSIYMRLDITKMDNYPAEEGAMPALMSTSIGRRAYNLVPGYPRGCQRDLDVKLCSRKCLQRKENQTSSKIEREDQRNATGALRWAGFQKVK